MNKIKRNIPNAITCGNLLCGCLAIVKAFEGSLVGTAFWVGIALVFDFLDGFLARMLKVTSPIGKDLDSLADMVTFGVVPGVVMFKLLLSATINENPWVYTSYIAFIIPMFSAIRLARFNNDKNQKESFIGLPTPANAIFICSLPLVIESYGKENPSILLNPHILILISCASSILLIAPLPLFSFKFKSFGWKGNEIRFVFLLLSLVLLITLQFVGIPLIIVLYIVMSVINNLFFKPKEK
ncbi:MAG: CDP-diacylglycerol--serine O-phosphatidyltransferase [Bacteroidia bacterium]